MRPIAATVVHNEPLVGRLSRLLLAAEPLRAARPGQGIAIAEPGSRTILAHPYPIAAMDSGGTIGVIYSNQHVLAPWLAALPPGSALRMLGPWGRPFSRDALARHAVLLGAGLRLLGLVALASALVEDGVAVVVLHDAPTATDLVPPALLPAAAEYQVATADGSAGIVGTALDLLPPLLSWADALYAALPAGAYISLRDRVHRHRLRPRRGFASVLAEAPLACYAAACDGCAVSLRNGYRLLCKDGPAFDLLDVE